MKRQTILILSLLILVAVIGGGALVDDLLFGEQHHREYTEKQLEKTWGCDFTYKGKSDELTEDGDTVYYFTQSLKPEMTVTAYYYEGRFRGPMSVVPPPFNNVKEVHDNFLQLIADEYLLELNGSDVIDITDTDKATEIIYSVCSEAGNFKSTNLRIDEMTEHFRDTLTFKISGGDKDGELKFSSSSDMSEIQKELEWWCIKHACDI